MARVITTILVKQYDEVKMVPSGSGTIGNFIDRRIGEMVHDAKSWTVPEDGQPEDRPQPQTICVEISEDDWEALLRFSK